MNYMLLSGGGVIYIDMLIFPQMLLIKTQCLMLS